MKTSKIIVFTVMLSVLLLSSTALSEENSNVLYVDDDGTADYTSIQDAIDNASEGDTIFVYNGTYFENIVTTKSITLFGENKHNTIICGNGSDTVLIATISTNISGFTITNKMFSGSGIYIVYSMKQHNGLNHCICGNIISNNTYGIRLVGSSYNLIYNNTIANNSEIGISTASFPSFYENIFSENNTIYHNNFLNNKENVNDSSKNTWYNAELCEGNYWDDYNGTDKNNDGIGDTSYNISSNAEDMYPFMNPYYGKIVITDFYVDEGSVQLMLFVGMIVTIIFCIPIGLWWRKKYFK